MNESNPVSESGETIKVENMIPESISKCIEDIEHCDEIGRSSSSIPRYNWLDITSEFTSACEELKSGELLHDSSFSLFEGMSAIEMMDPKMDAGMICNQTKHKVLNFQQAIQNQSIKLEGFTREELIGIIDHTLSCVVTWLEGHSLAQTVFINLYLHDPKMIKDRTLKAFSVCILKLVDLIRDKINRAGVYEEEDFQTMTYNFKMANDETEAQAINGVKDVEEDLNRIVKNTRVRPGVDRDAATEKEHELSSALCARIRFTRLFYASVLAFSREKCQGVPDAEKHLKQMKEIIDSMKKTIDLGIQKTDDENGDCSSIMGFEPLVNQRLLPPTFPRYTKIKGCLDTMEYLDAMISRLQQICSVVPLTNFHEIIDFFLDFSKPSPCLLSRSLLQLLVLPMTFWNKDNRRLFGTNPMIDVLKDTLRSFCAPPVLLQKCPMYNNYQVKEFIDSFLIQAIQPLTSILKIAGHNRARQRDKWGHLLDDFGVLQDEAEKLDSCFNSLMLKVDPNWQYRMCFGTWVLYLILRVMICYTVAGLELELYSVHEYNYVFWYLCEGLYNWMMSTVNRAETFVYDHDIFLSDQHKGRSAKKIKKKKKPRTASAELMLAQAMHSLTGGYYKIWCSLLHLLGVYFSDQHKGRSAKKIKKKKKPRTASAELMLAQAMHSLTGGYYKAVIGLTMDNKLRGPKFDFDCEEYRYNHRFAPFGSVSTPPLMHYQQFRETTDVSRCNPPLHPSDLYNGAGKCFQQAKAHLESIQSPSEEVQSLLKVTKTNLVVMRLLSGGHKKDCKTPPEFEYVVHKLFPVIKLP